MQVFQVVSLKIAIWCTLGSERGRPFHTIPALLRSGLGTSAGHVDFLFICLWQTDCSSTCSGHVPSMKLPQACQCSVFF